MIMREKRTFEHALDLISWEENKRRRKMTDKQRLRYLIDETWWNETLLRGYVTRMKNWSLADSRRRSGCYGA
jgi:hypothetical protein